MPDQPCSVGPFSRGQYPELLELDDEVEPGHIALLEKKHVPVGGSQHAMPDGGSGQVLWHSKSILHAATQTDPDELVLDDVLLDDVLLEDVLLDDVLLEDVAPPPPELVLPPPAPPPDVVLLPDVLPPVPPVPSAPPAPPVVIPPTPPAPNPSCDRPPQVDAAKARKKMAGRERGCTATSA